MGLIPLQEGLVTVSSTLRQTVILALLFSVGCGGGGTDPSDVTFGETTFVVLVNPVVNTANGIAVPPPGAMQNAVTVGVDGGPTETSGDGGVAVLAPVIAGARTLSLSGGTASGTTAVSIVDRDLVEVAMALDGSGAAVMANVRYEFGGQVVQINSTTPLAEVNAALSQSNIIVFFSAGTYTGDLVFSGSNVTLFGQGASGGLVTLSGNVTVSGSGNRIRGTRIVGNLSVPGSNAGVSFTRVAGTLTAAGSSAVFLNNAFCGVVTVSGSNSIVLGNAGLDPIPAPLAGC